MRLRIVVFVAVVAAALAAPTNPEGTTTTSSSITSKNMTEERDSTGPTTQNMLGDVVAVTPPNAESIELGHLDDNTRFYPDYNDQEAVSYDHFTEPTNTERPSKQRSKRQTDDYDAMSYEMYLDPSYQRERREVGEEPYRIDLDIPIDSDTGHSTRSDSGSSSMPDVQATRSPESDRDSLSTQVTYVIISEDDSSPSASVEEVMGSLNYPLEEEHTTEVIDIAVPSSEEGTTSSDSSSSSSSTDSKEERQRVFRAIAATIRGKRGVRSDNPKYRRRRSSVDEESKSSTSLSSSETDVSLHSRKTRQLPHYRTDITSYRIGRSVDDSDSDDVEPEEARGQNMRDQAMDETQLKLLDGFAPLPEYASEYAELQRPSRTYVNGQLRDTDTSGTYYRLRAKRSLPSQEGSKTGSVESESTTEASFEPTTLSPGLDVVTATYPLGIDATKNNLSLPEGNFLGPRVYAKGDLIQEEQPAFSGIAVPMEKEQTIPVLNGSETETVYSAPLGGMNLPLLIPVVGPTAHPGDQPRIELSLPSGYVPYIIQISPAATPTPKAENQSPPINMTISPTLTSTTTEVTTAYGTTSAQPEVQKFVTNMHTFIVEASTSPSPVAPSEMSNASTQTYASVSVPEMLPLASIPTSSKGLASAWLPEDVSRSGNMPQDSNKTWTSTQPENTEGVATTSFPEMLPTSANNVGALEPTSVDKQQLPQQPNLEPETSKQSNALLYTTISPTTPREAVGPTPGDQQLSGQLTLEPEISKQSNTPLSTTVSPAMLRESRADQQTGVWGNSEVTPESLPPLTQTTSILNQSTDTAGNSSGTNEKLKELVGVIHQSATSDFEPPSGQSSSAASIGQKVEPTTSLVSQDVSSPSTGNIADPDGVAVRPFDWKRTRAAKRSGVVPILEKNSVMSPNGSFSYSFRSANGIQVQESGYLKKSAPTESRIGDPSVPSNAVSQAVQGSYSYTAPDGRLISVRYVADENGFRAEGNDLPR